MQFFAKLIKKITHLFGLKKPHIDVSRIEVDELCKQFDVLAEANRLAQLGLPAFHSKTITNIELEIVRYIERARDHIQRQTQTDLDKMDALIQQTQTSQLDIKMSQLTADFERQALIVFNEQNAWLEKLGNTAKRKTQELERFRQRNRLDRDAIYPSGSGLFLRYALLLMVVVAEGVFNASFFAEGLASGLLGGFAYAATMAAVNVVVMFLLGKTLLRCFFHVSPGLKAIGFVSGVFSLVYTFTLALSVAHLRWAIMNETTNPTQMAWSTLISAPFALNDMMSWVLVLVTLGFGLTALVDDLFVDDLYPGYGAITRREKEAVEEFEEEFAQVRDNLEDIKQNNLSGVEDEIIKANHLAARFRQLIDDKKTIYKSWQQTLDNSEIALYAVLRMFRAENEKRRHDGMRPAYFDTLPSLAPVSLEKPNMQQLEREHQLMLEKIKTLEVNLQERREHIHRTFDKHLDQLNFIKSRQPLHAA